MSLVLRQMLSRNATVDDAVVVVVAGQHLAVELLLCLIVGTVALGLAEAQDDSLECVLAFLFKEGLYRDRTPVIVAPIRLYSQVFTSLSSLGDRECFLLVEEFLADILHVGFSFGNDVDESDPVF